MRANEHSLSANLASVRDYLQIVEWSASDIGCDETQLGLAGSPTKVKDVQAVVFQAKESKRLTSSDEDVKELMVELMASHTLG
jgi:electron transfer flavoprotein beta subunit